MAKYWKENQEGLLNDGEALTILMMLYNEHPYVVQLPCLYYIFYNQKQKRE